MPFFLILVAAPLGSLKSAVDLAGCEWTYQDAKLRLEL